MTDENLLLSLESIQNILIDYATGGDADEDEFKRLRRQVVQDPRVKNDLPRFLKTCRSLSQFWGFIKRKFDTYAERRHFLYSEFAPLLNRLEHGSEGPADKEISGALSNLEASYVDEIWHKALDRKVNDPEGAVTAARTLLESVCKSILDEQGIEYDDKAKLPKLYHLTAESLNLAPSQHSEELFSKILGNCQSVVGTLGAIRNAHSDAHGDGKTYYKPASRHAELAVNLAGSMAMFLVRTWSENSESV